MPRDPAKATSHVSAAYAGRAPTSASIRAVSYTKERAVKAPPPFTSGHGGAAEVTKAPMSLRQRPYSPGRPSKRELEPHHHHDLDESRRSGPQDGSNIVNAPKLQGRLSALLGNEDS
jgi:hypothetical protein